MVGTMINVATVIGGSLAGTLIGARMSYKLQETAIAGLGLVTLLIGVKMALETANVLILLGAILGGGVMGELLCIQDGLEWLGARVQDVFSKGGSSRVSEAFVTASLLYCVGPMAILGSIQDGLQGDYQLLAVKSMLDGFASIAFSATLGWGVGLAAVSVFLFQGSITLGASVFDRILTGPMITELSAVGGLIIMAIGLKLLEVKEIRVANLLPALFLAPFIVAVIPLVKGLFW